MKGLLSIVLVLALVGAGGWWLVQQKEKVAAEAEARRQAAALSEQERRAAVFGPEGQAADIQWRPSGFGYRIEREGTGPRAIVGDKVRVLYVGRLKDGTIFDQAKEPKIFPLGSLIPGMTAGLQMLGAGGKGTFFIPPNLGYGARSAGPIPANAGLIFEVEVLALNP